MKHNLKKRPELNDMTQSCRCCTCIETRRPGVKHYISRVKFKRLQKRIRFLGLFELTLHIIICFPTGDPLSSLKAPVVRIRQNNFHKDVVMSREVETGDVETEEWEHASAQGKEEREKEL